MAEAGTSAYHGAGVAGRLTFSWLAPLLAAGVDRQLAPADLFRLEDGDAAAACADAFSAAWAAERARCPAVPSLPRAILAAFGGPFWSAAPLKAADDALAFVAPWAVAGILRAFDPAAGVPSGEAAAYAAALLAKAVAQTLLRQHYFLAVIRVGLRVRAALSSAIHGKALTVVGGGRVAGAGDVTNLIAVDAERLGPSLFTFAHMLWAGPTTVAVGLACLCATIGAPATAATAVVLAASVPANLALSAALRRSIDVAMAAKDLRLRRLGEALGAVRAVKLHGWEGRVLDGPSGVANGRRTELAALLRVRVWDAAGRALWQLVPVLMSAAAFATLTMGEGRVLSPAVAFTALTLFRMIQFPLSMAPEVVAALLEARVAADRVTAFLSAPEVAGRRTAPPPKPLGWTPAAHEEPARWTAPAAFHGGIARWPGVDGRGAAAGGDGGSLGPIVLRDVTLAFPAGTLTAIVGPVGAGKSSLLAALLGELAFTPPNAAPHLSGCVGYAAQTPWVLNATVRANILYHQPFDAGWYDAIVAACALAADLASLPAGDATEVGERGLTLSGGQAARVSLARALYRRPDVLLLDDVFSALDATVGHAIFEATLAPGAGLCAGVTTVLATHDLSLLPQADRVVVLGQGGVVVDSGTYDQVAARGNALQDVRRYDGAREGAEGAPAAAAACDSGGQTRPGAERNGAASLVGKDSAAGKGTGAGAPSGRLMTVEARVAGKVRGSVYTHYAHAFGPSLLVAAAATAAAAQAFLLGTDGWLARWSTVAVEASARAAAAASGPSTTEAGSPPLVPTAFFLCVYLGLSVAVVIGIISHQAVMAWGALRASSRLHDRLLAAVFRAPMAWYDATPVGRTLNLLSADLGVVDSELSQSAVGTLHCGLVVGTSLAVCCWVMPPVLVAVVPLAALYTHHAWRYLASARELRRLQSVARAPLLAALTESVRGAPTVRSAFPSPLPAAIADAPAVVDGVAVPTYLVLAANRWLCVRLDAAGGVLVTTVASAAVGARGTNGGVSAATAGLAVTWALALAGNLNWLTMSYTRLESQMTSVERVIHTVATLPSEAPATVPHEDAAAAVMGWPAAGRVEFEGVTLVYRPGLPPALKGAMEGEGWGCSAGGSPAQKRVSVWTGAWLTCVGCLVSLVAY